MMLAATLDPGSPAVSLPPDSEALGDTRRSKGYMDKCHTPLSADLLGFLRVEPSPRGRVSASWGEFEGDSLAVNGFWSS